MHVSPGLGTTFVPFRFFARPEATELVLRTPSMMEGKHDLDRHPRELCRRRGARGRGSARARGERAPGTRACGSREDDGRVRVELHLAVEWGASIPEVGAEVQRRVAAYLGRMAEVEPEAVDVIVDEIGPRRDGPRVAGLTGATLQNAPTVCHDCVWWQSRDGRTTRQAKWIEKAEKEWGAWGTVYYDDDGSARVDAVRARASSSRARPSCLPARRRTTRCSSRARTSSRRRSPWVMQSLFLAAIGDARDRGAKALETFAYRYREGESPYERFQVHKTIFPSDFLADFGFQTVRARAAWSWRASSSAGWCRSPKARARRCCAS